MRSSRILLCLLLPALPLLASCDDPADAGGSAPVQLSLTSPAASDSVTSDSVEIAGTATSTRTITSIRYTVNGGPEAPIAIEPGTEVIFHAMVGGLALGANEVEVRAYNGGDSPGQAVATFVVIDVDDPTLEITTPASEEMTPRDSVRIEGVARDERGVAALQQSLDGGAAEDVEITGGEQVDFGFTLHPDPGEHLLVVTAVDGSGNSVVDSLRFTTAVARVAIDRPATDSVLGSFAMTLTGEIESPVPVARITTRLNEGQEVDRCFVESPGLCSSPPSAKIGISIAFDGLPHGESTLELTAYGADGTILGVDRTRFTVAVPVKQYRITYLGTLGGDDSQGAELNEKDQVVGWALDAAGDQHAFLWSGQMRDLGTALGSSSAAHGINESGVVVGEYTSDCVRAFRYLPDASGPETIAEACGRRGMDVNDAGDVVLWDPGSESTPEQGFILDAEGSHHLQYGDRSPLTLLRINNRRQVLGLNHSTYGPTIYSTSAEPLVREFCPGSDLNDRGDVTAMGCKAGPSTVVFDDGSHANIPDIGLTGYSGSVATAINNRGEVAGSYYVTSSGTRPVHAFLWDGKQTFDVEYDSDAWRIDSVSDLNDAGVILAHGTNTVTGQKGAVLLHPLD